MICNGKSNIKGGYTKVKTTGVLPKRPNSKGNTSYWKVEQEPDAIRFLKDSRKLEGRELSSHTLTSKALKEVKEWLGKFSPLDILFG